MYIRVAKILSQFCHYGILGGGRGGGAIIPFPSKPWFLGVCSISLENTRGKGEIARNEQFLLFPQCFLPIWRTFCPFSSHSKLSSASALNLEESEICHLGKG